MRRYAEILKDIRRYAYQPTLLDPSAGSGRLLDPTVAYSAALEISRIEIQREVQYLVTMKLYLAIALRLCACGGQNLSDAEVAAVKANTPIPIAGYQTVTFGAARDSTLGWELVSNEGEKKIYSLPGDSLAFGVVPVSEIYYTFNQGKAEDITIEGPKDFSKLRACLELIYGKPTKQGALEAIWNTGEAMIVCSSDRAVIMDLNSFNLL